MRGLEEEMVGVIFLVRRLFNERGDGGGGRGVATWAGRGGAGPVMTVVAVSSEWPSAVTTGVPSHPVWDTNIKVNIFSGSEASRSCWRMYGRQCWLVAGFEIII